MTTTRTEIMIIALSAALGGIVFGYVLCDNHAKAFDPCDPNNESSKYTYEKHQYNPDDDAAMQFKWKDHQPTLRSR